MLIVYRKTNIVFTEEEERELEKAPDVYFGVTPKEVR